MATTKNTDAPEAVDETGTDTTTEPATETTETTKPADKPTTGDTGTSGSKYAPFKWEDAPKTVSKPNAGKDSAAADSKYQPYVW